MKMWRVCFLMLICPGLFVAFGLTGCGENACEDNPCAKIEHALADSCLVIEEDNFACLCCKPTGEDGIPCKDDEDLITQWDENSKTCVVEEE